MKKEKKMFLESKVVFFTLVSFYLGYKTFMPFQLFNVNCFCFFLFLLHLMRHSISLYHQWQFLQHFLRQCWEVPEICSLVLIISGISRASLILRISLQLFCYNISKTWWTKVTEDSWEAIKVNNVHCRQEILPIWD